MNHTTLVVECFWLTKRSHFFVNQTTLVLLQICKFDLKICLFVNHTSLVSLHVFDLIKITYLKESFVLESKNTGLASSFWFTKENCFIRIFFVCVWIRLHWLHCMFLIHIKKQSHLFMNQASLVSLYVFHSLKWTHLKESIICESDKSTYYFSRLILVYFTEWVIVPQPVKVSNSCFSEPDTKTNADR